MTRHTWLTLVFVCAAQAACTRGTHASALRLGATTTVEQSGALRRPFVASAFAIVGPATDPAQVHNATTAADAFRRIAAARAPFISRADSSGTHVKELAIWGMAGISPAGAKDSWYVQAGMDQSATLRIADERSAY